MVATRDVITDFEAETDLINLLRIDAIQGSGGGDAFTSLGAGAAPLPAAGAAVGSGVLHRYTAA